MSKPTLHSLSIDMSEACRVYTMKVYDKNDSEFKNLKQVSLFIKDILKDNTETVNYQSQSFSKQPLNKFNIIIDKDTDINILIAQLALNKDKDLETNDNFHQGIVKKLQGMITISVDDGVDHSNDEGILPG